MYNELIKSIEKYSKKMKKSDLVKVVAYFCAATFAYCAMTEIQDGKPVKAEELDAQAKLVFGYIVTILEHDLETVAKGNEIRKDAFQTIYKELDKFLEVPNGVA